jgi:hypothetical protein
METEFITLQLPLALAQQPLELEAALADYGYPLRWAIVQVQGHYCQIEAIVTRLAPPEATP